VVRDAFIIPGSLLPATRSLCKGVLVRTFRGERCAEPRSADDGGVQASDKLGSIGVRDTGVRRGPEHVSITLENYGMPFSRA
jgi:hypothetical protein